MSETGNTDSVGANTNSENSGGEASQEQGQENQQPNSQPSPPSKRKYKYKADNQEFEEELGDDEVASRLSLAKAANKRMQEAALTKKEIHQFMKQLQEDPMSILGDDRIMGNKKFREMAEKFLLKQIEEESYTPEQRQQIEKDRRLQDYERREKEAKEAHEKQQAQALEQHYTKQFETTIIQALQSSNLPKNTYTVKRMAELMQKNLAHGMNLNPQQLAQLVKEDYQNELKSVMGNAEPEQLLSMFGEDVANKIRKHDLSKFQPKNPEPKDSTPREEAPQKKLSSREWDEQLRAKWQKK